MFSLGVGIDNLKLAGIDEVVRKGDKNKMTEQEITKLLTLLAGELRAHPELKNDTDGNNVYYWFNDILGDDVEIRVMLGRYDPEQTS